MSITFGISLEIELFSLFVIAIRFGLKESYKPNLIAITNRLDSSISRLVPNIIDLSLIHI